MRARVLKISVILGVSLVLGFAAHLITTRTQPYRISQVLGANHPTTLAYENYLSKYNDENTVLFLVETQTNLFEGDSAYKIERSLVEQLERTQGLKRVGSLSRSQYLTHHKNKTKLRLFFEDGNLRPEGKRLLTSHPLWKNSYLSQDGKSILVTADIRPDLTPIQENEMIDRMLEYAKLTESSFPQIKIHLLGGKVAAYYFNQELLKQQSIVTPLSALIIALFLYFLFKSFLVVALCLLSLAFAFAVNAILILTIEGGLNPYTHFALVFVSVVATADLVHFFSAYLTQTRGPIESRLRDTYKKIIKPCFFTAFTTWIGFLSVCFTGVRAIDRFGFYASTGIVICFLMTFYGLPWFIKVCGLNLNQTLEAAPKSSSQFFMKTVLKRGGLILKTTLVLCVLSVFFATKIRVDDNLYAKFVDDHPLSKSLVAFSKHLNFTGAIDVLVKVDRAPLLSGDFETRLAGALEKVNQTPNVAQSRSILNYLAYMREIMGRTREVAPDFGRDKNLAHLFELVDRAGLLGGVWLKAQNEIRITVRLQDISSEKTLQTIQSIERIFEEFQIAPVISGFTAVRVQMLHEITWGFIISFGIDLVVIFFCFVFLLRSWSWAALAMIPNLVPIALLMGALGALGILVEDTVILTMSILFGIAVDDTIHFTHGIRENQKRGIPVLQSIEGSYQQNWMSIVGTTLIFVLTAPCTLLTDFLMFSKMTFFFTAAMILALVTELFVMPVLVLRKEKYGKITAS